VFFEDEIPAAITTGASAVRNRVQRFIFEFGRHNING
jgi:hypothetical protein